MHYRPYDRIEQRILNSDTGSIYLRWKWGRLVLCDPDLTYPNGRLIKGSIDELIAKAWAHGSKLSRSEVKYRLQVARTYQTEGEIGHACGQFQSWSDLRTAGFPASEVPPDAAEDVLFGTAGDSPEGTSESTVEGPQPYDPRPPYKRRDDAERQLSRILNSPEAKGIDPLPGMAIYLPGFTPDTVGPETAFREAFKIHRYICDEVTPQLRKAADQAERDDRERETKLNLLFSAVGRNMEATLGDGEAALFAQNPPEPSHE